jgi:hypothetical protein
MTQSVIDLNNTLMIPHCCLECRGPKEDLSRTQREGFEEAKRRNIKTTTRFQPFITVFSSNHHIKNSNFEWNIPNVTVFVVVRHTVFLTPSHQNGCFRREITKRHTGFRRPSQRFPNTITYGENVTESCSTFVSSVAEMEFRSGLTERADL